MDRALKEARFFALRICASLEDPIDQIWEIHKTAGVCDNHVDAMVEVLQRHGYLELLPCSDHSPPRARFTSRIAHLLENARSRARRREAYKARRSQRLSDK